MVSAEHLIEMFNLAKLRPPGPERDAFLAEACGDDAELRGQILSLLRAHDKAGGFLQGQPELSPELETEFMRLKPEKAGGRIGPYILREQIGEGGFGTVWVAEQQLPVRRTVALKIIKLGMDTRDVVARFEQERQALAVMDHPSIAKVFDAGATEEGRPYFVMELVRGIRITDYCDQANLPTPERLRLFIDVCHAVQHAHQKGIIHRDIKPSNILVTLQDGAPVPKVIDFGVAKATQGPLTELTIYTRALDMVGTPLYMSPEQAEMNGLDVDTRTDIYALGVLLYELLTGRTPFDADTLRKAGYDEVRRIIREQEPQKPSTALHTMAQGTLTSVAQHRASEPPKLIHAIRGDLDWIVMKTLEKDRSRRYETANGLAADIRRHLENEAVAARPPSRAYQFQKLVRRNKLAFFSAAAIIAALFIGLATTTWMYLRESEARKRATVAEELATERLAEVSAERDAKEVARQEAEAISTFMSEVFQSPNPARDGRTITVAETLDSAAKKLETDLAKHPLQQARFQATLADTYHSLGLTAKAIPLQERVYELSRASFGVEHQRTLSSMRSLSTFYWTVHRYPEALALREEAVAVGTKHLGAEHRDTLAAMSGLADSYAADWRYKEARQLREKVLTLCLKVLGPEHPNTIGAMHSLATSYAQTGLQQEALELREQVLILRRKSLGPENPDTIVAMNEVANSYRHAGRHEEALKLSEKVLASRRKILGPDHSFTLSATSDLADSYFRAGRYDEALTLREEALPIFKRVLPPQDGSLVRLRANLAESYRRAGRASEADALLGEISQAMPHHTHSALKIGALHAWFSRDADHLAVCEHLLRKFGSTDHYQAGERIAKIACLRPLVDSIRDEVLSCAQRSLKLGQAKAEFLPFAHLALGMVKYRIGDYPAAEASLSTAGKAASAAELALPEITADFFRVMCLSKQGREAEARKLFADAQARMKPLPVNEMDPIVAAQSNHDDLICWLAFKEARELLYVPSDGMR